MVKAENHFDESRAEVFDAIGHPIRVRILDALEKRPMGFAELKKAAGVESSGHLQFHLGKLTGLVDTTSDGSYVLTDEGREAVRVLNLTTSGSSGSLSGGKASLLRRSSWTRPLIAVLMILVLVLSGVAAYQQQAGLATPRTVTTTQLLPCTGQLIWSLNSNSSLIPVLLMRPNATAYVCVIYQTWWKGNPDYNFTGNPGVPPTSTFQFSPFLVSNEMCKPSPYGCRPDISNAFRVSVEPTSVQLNGYTNYVSVLFTITALANSTGYYSNSAPYLACSSMPMAVGHTASEVNITDFGPIISPVCGPFSPIHPVLLAVSGMGVTYLNP